MIEILSPVLLGPVPLVPLLVFTDVFGSPKFVVGGLSTLAEANLQWLLPTRLICTRRNCPLASLTWKWLNLVGEFPGSFGVRSAQWVSATICWAPQFPEVGTSCVWWPGT